MARVLFLGQLFEGSTALGRVRAFEELGYEVRPLEAFGTEQGLTRLARLVRRRTGLGPSHPLNRTLVSAAELWSPDVVWVEKGIHVTPAALHAVRRARPAARLIHYTCDRTAVPGNASRDLLAALPLYDLAATTVREEVEAFRAWGARHVVRTWHGYDPALFRPPAPETLDLTLSARAVFVGSWEFARAATLKSMALSGVPLTVISPWKQWSELAALPADVEWRRSSVYGQGYPVLLASAGVSLGFLRKLSRDEHTQRSFEIPACGGVLLAERTPEHLELFREGVEAEFFGCDVECAEKARALLARPEHRSRVAAAGLRRVRCSDYSWSGRIRAILQAL